MQELYESLTSVLDQCDINDLDDLIDEFMKKFKYLKNAMVIWMNKLGESGSNTKKFVRDNIYLYLGMIDEILKEQ